MNPIKNDNRHPDCVLMKLHAKPLVNQEKGSFLSASSTLPTREQIELRLTIRFGEQTIEEDGSTIKVGLKGGELGLRLKNSQILLETMGLIPEFQSAIEIEIQKEDSKDDEKSGKLSISPDITTKNKTTTKVVTKVRNPLYQVYGKGTEESPSWVFQAKTDEPILQGILREAIIGILEINTKPCSVEAVFEVKNEDICLTEVSGKRIKDIEKSKGKIIDMRIRKYESLQNLLASKFQPCFSKMEFLYE